MAPDFAWGVDLVVEDGITINHESTWAAVKIYYIELRCGPRLGNDLSGLLTLTGAHMEGSNN